MAEYEYPNNSLKAREEQEKPKETAKPAQTPEKKVEKVVQNRVTRKKETMLSKVQSEILPGDTNSLKDYILRDVLIPSIKRAISDIVCNGINMMLGEPNRKGGNQASRVSYRSYYDDDRDRRNENRPRAVQPNYSDLQFDTRADAQEVLERMEELVEQFGIVSIADMMDLAGMTPQYTDYKYGWRNLRDAYVENYRGYYMIRLPRSSPI